MMVKREGMKDKLREGLESYVLSSRGRKNPLTCWSIELS